MRHTRALISLTILLAMSTASAEIVRWRRYEIERNDLHLNPRIYHQLPSSDELAALQVNSLLSVTVPAGAVRVLANSQAAGILPEFVDPHTGDVRFFIHPTATELFAPLMKDRKVEVVEADPTSSPRTYFWNQVNLKLSLPQKINGVIRTVYPLQMERALAISEMLGELSPAAPGAEHFNYLPEVLGIYDARIESPFGFIVRLIPRSIIEGTTTLAPLTAYCAEGKGGDPSLFELDARSRGLSMAQYARTSLAPALTKAFSAAASLGIALEAHQQNLLIELDHLGRFTGRVFYRDLDGARVDFDLRAKLGLSTEHLTKVSNADWVFDLERIRVINHSNYSPKGRPIWWSGLIEKAFATYLVGSSFDLLERSIKRVDGGNPQRLSEVANEELHRLAKQTASKTEKSTAITRELRCEGVF